MVNELIEDVVHPRQTVEPNLVDPPSFACGTAGTNGFHPLVLIGLVFKGVQNFQVLRTFLGREDVLENQETVEVKEEAFLDTNRCVLGV